MLSTNLFPFGLSLCCSKGVHSNSADWGSPMPELWTRTLASRPGECDMSSWVPDVVVINLGLNDLSPPASAETDIIQAYAAFVAQVRTRKFRPELLVDYIIRD